MSGEALALGACLEEYLVSLRVERGLAANTITAYSRDLRQYLSFLDGREPDDTLVGSYLTELARHGLAPSTINRKVAAVRGFHRFLLTEEMRETDPTILLDTPRRPDPFPKPLTVSEAIRLMEAPGSATVPARRDTALLEFLYGTGARVSETVDLDLGMLDLTDRVAVLTGKGSKQRLVPLGTKAVEAMERWLPDRLTLVKTTERGNPVFLNLRGRRLSRQGAFQIVRKHARGSGIDPGRASPHVLRHSAATHMVEAGADLRTVQEMLGHATITTTQVYTRVSPTHLMEVYVHAHPRSR